MFSKKKTLFREGFDAVVGENTKLKGNIYCEGSVRIDGNVEGDINSAGDILLGANSCVKGNIIANNVQLSGTIEGNLQLTGMLRISSTGRLYGDIQVKNFVSDEGAVFQGKCTMIEVPQIESSDNNYTAENGSQTA